MNQASISTFPRALHVEPKGNNKIKSEIKHLPREILQKIYQLLPSRDRPAFRLVERYWRELANQAQVNLIVKCLTPSLVESFPNVCALTIHRPENRGDDDLALTSRFQHLNLLDLAGNRLLTNDAIASALSNRNLRVLNLTGCTSLGDASLAEVVKLENLRTLNLSKCAQITGRGVSELSVLRDLQILNLVGSAASTDEGLSNLRRFSRLQALSVGSYASNESSVKLTNAGLKHLSRLKQLRILSLHNATEIGDRGIVQLTSLKSLQILSLNGCSQLSPTGLARAATLAHLVALDLSHCDVSEDFLKSLKRHRADLLIEITGCEIALRVQNKYRHVFAAMHRANLQSVISACLHSMGDQVWSQMHQSITRECENSGVKLENDEISAMILTILNLERAVPEISTQPPHISRAAKLLRFFSSTARRTLEFLLQFCRAVRSCATWLLSRLGL